MLGELKPKGPEGPTELRCWIFWDRESRKTRWTFPGTDQHGMVSTKADVIAACEAPSDAASRGGWHGASGGRAGGRGRPPALLRIFRVFAKEYPLGDENSNTRMDFPGV